MGSQYGSPLIQSVNEIIKSLNISYPIISLLLCTETHKWDNQGPIILVLSEF